MTSTNRGTGAAPRPRSSSGEDGPESFSTQIQRIATQRPPPPPGKGIAMMVIAVAVVLAIIWQMTWGSDMGPAGVIDDFHRDDPSKTAAPKPKAEALEAEPEMAPVATPRRAPRPAVTVTTESTDAAVPAMRPGANVRIPEGLDAQTTARLQLNVAALDPANFPAMSRDAHRLVAEGGVRELPLVLRSAPEVSREKVGRYVVETLVQLVLSSKALGVPALDAGLTLLDDGSPYVKPLVESAGGAGLARNETAAAALVLLDAAGVDARAAYVAAVEAVAKDETRPEHLRRLAGRMLEGWKAE